MAKMTTIGKTTKGVMVVTLTWRCRRSRPPCCSFTLAPSSFYHKSSVFFERSDAVVAIAVTELVACRVKTLMLHCI